MCADLTRGKRRDASKVVLRVRLFRVFVFAPRNGIALRERELGAPVRCN